MVNSPDTRPLLGVVVKATFFSTAFPLSRGLVEDPLLERL